MLTHTYIRYAIALILGKNQLSKESEITYKHIKQEIENGLNSFCVRPKEKCSGRAQVEFEYVNERNCAPSSVFLSPHVISSEKKSTNLYNEVQNKCKGFNEADLEKKKEVKQSQIPTTGFICCFTTNGNVSRGNPKASNKDICYGLITTLTPLKPSLQYVHVSNGKISAENVCLIPDLELLQMIDFIKLFKRMQLQQLEDLMIGPVQGNKPKRPKLFRGNFPFAPRSGIFGPIALLGAIGEMMKEKDVSELALRVLESFKDNYFYIFKYGGASVFRFNNHIIDIAEKSHLSKVVNSLYGVSLYNRGQRSTNDAEYQKFDLFASRFLQLFSKPTFKDFLSFRAEYPKEIEIIFKSYFTHMEHISEDIILSAEELGQWLNSVAYGVANKELANKEEQGEGQEKLRNLKAKVLVELESSILASKSADALIAHTIARAGRLSAKDAPTGASLFMEKTISGDLSLEQAKNLLIAFSRLKSSYYKSSGIEDITNTASRSETEEESADTDLSNI